MRVLNIGDLRTGDRIRVGNEVLVVIAKLNEDSLLVDSGRIVEFSKVASVYDLGLDMKFVIISYPDVEIFRSHGLQVYGFSEVLVGDILIDVSGIIGELVTVAVIDVPRKTAYSQNGEMLLSDSSIYLKTGWRTKATDLLTEDGKYILSKLYQ